MLILIDIENKESSNNELMRLNVAIIKDIVPQTLPFLEYQRTLKGKRLLIFGVKIVSLNKYISILKANYFFQSFALVTSAL